MEQASDIEAAASSLAGRVFGVIPGEYAARAGVLLDDTSWRTTDPPHEVARATR